MPAATSAAISASNSSLVGAEPAAAATLEAFLTTPALVAVAATGAADLYYLLNPMLTYKLSEKTLSSITCDEWNGVDLPSFCDLFTCCEYLSKLKGIDTSVIKQVRAMLSREVNTIVDGELTMRLYVELLSKKARLEALVYFPMNIISWVKWYKHKDEENELLAKSRKLTAWQHVMVVLIIAAITTIVFFALSAVAGDTWMKFAAQFGWNTTVMKWLDSTIFAIGIVAVVLEALRFKEQYVWWLVTDVIAVAQYILKGDPVYATKKMIYLIEAVIGILFFSLLLQRFITER